MHAEERQQAMASDAALHGRLSVSALAEKYDVTPETVRRDLTVLADLGLVRRVHGGAVAVDSLTSLEIGLRERDAVRTAEKDRIAAAAVGLLPPPGASVLVDAGSTTVRFAEALPVGHRLIAFTHSVPVAARLSRNPAIELHLLPGRVRATTQAAVGAVTVAALADLRVDLAFVGTNGVTVAHGFSTPDSDEAATKAAIVGAAQQAVVLADSTKVGVQSTVRFAEIDQVDALVTDDDLSDSDRDALIGAGLRVVVA